MPSELDLGPMLPVDYTGPDVGGWVMGGECNPTGNEPDGGSCFIAGIKPTDGKCDDMGCSPESGACALGFGP